MTEQQPEQQGITFDQARLSYLEDEIVEITKSHAKRVSELRLRADVDKQQLMQQIQSLQQQLQEARGDEGAPGAPALAAVPDADGPKKKSTAKKTTAKKAASSKSKAKKDPEPPV